MRLRREIGVGLADLTLSQFRAIRLLLTEEDRQARIDQAARSGDLMAAARAAAGYIS